MRTLEQQRASFAWKWIASVREGNKDAAKIAMHLQRLPAMVLTNGLGQTLAFLLQKSDNKASPEYDVYDVLAKWIVDERKLYEGTRDQLMQRLITGDRFLYQQAQEEICALLVWLKKLAAAYLEKPSLPKEGDS
ncbi:MAG: type III-B CRISPR module-associated protein Cmr5 [Limnochordia bacterium]